MDTERHDQSHEPSSPAHAPITEEIITHPAHEEGPPRMSGVGAGEDAQPTFLDPDAADQHKGPTKLMIGLGVGGALLVLFGFARGFIFTDSDPSPKPRAQVQSAFTEQQQMMREAMQMARDAQEMQRERMRMMNDAMMQAEYGAAGFEDGGY